MSNGDGVDYEINYLNIDKTLYEKKKKLAQHHFAFGLIFSLYILCLIFYFALPTFKVKNMSIDGLIYLSKENYLRLSEVNEDTSFLFFDANSAYQKAVSKAPFLILDGKAYSNPLVSKTEILENRPLFEYADQKYFISMTLAEVKNELAMLNDSLFDDYGNVLEELPVPKLHFNGDFSSYLSDFKQTMIFIDPDNLGQIIHLQFSLNENSSEKISSKVFAILKSPEIAENIGLYFNIDVMRYIFDNKYYGQIISKISEYINTSGSDEKLENKIFEDTDESISCYQFDLQMIDDSISIDWYGGSYE